MWVAVAISRCKCCMAWFEAWMPRWEIARPLALNFLLRLHLSVASARRHHHDLNPMVIIGVSSGHLFFMLYIDFPVGPRIIFRPNLVRVCPAD